MVIATVITGNRVEYPYEPALRTDVHSKMHVRTSGLLAGSNPASPTSYNKVLRAEEEDEISEV